MAGLSGANSSGGSAAVRAGRAFVELSLSGGGAVLKTLDRLRSRFQSFGNNLLKIGGLTGGIGTAVAAGFKPAINALDELAKVGNAADAFGLTAEKASRLFGLMAAGGSDIRDATEGIVTFNQRVEDGISGTGEEAAKLFAGLGKSADSFTGDSADKFYQLLDALRQVPDPAKRVQLLLKAVGEDTGKNLIPLLSMSAEQVRELGDSFAASAEDIATAREATRSQTLATAALGKVWRTVAVAVAPAVKEFAELISRNVGTVVEFVKANREAIVTAFKIAGAMVVAGGALLALGTAAGAVSTAIGGVVALGGTIASVVGGAFGIISAVVGAVLTPMGLLFTAVAALTLGLEYLFLTQTKAGRAYFGWIKGNFANLADIVTGTFRDIVGVGVEAWGGIAAAIGKGDLALAGEIAVTALELVWVRAVARAQTFWKAYSKPFLEAWHEVTDGLGMLFAEIWTVAKEVFFGIRDVVVEVFDSVWGAIKGVAARIEGIWTGLSDSAKKAIAFLAPILAPIVGPFLALADLVGQAWDGLSNNIMETLNNFTSWTEKSFVRMAASIENAFKSVARSVLDSVIGAAEVLNRFDPAGTLTAGIALAKDIRAGIGADVDPGVRVREIEAERKKLEDELRRTRELDKKLREMGDAAAAKVATDKAAELEAKLRGLVALAKAPGAFDFGGAAGAIAQALAGARAGGNQAAQITGSRGTFGTSMIGQRFGVETLAKQQLLAAQKNVAATEKVEKACVAIAKGLTFK